jgi:hypothetical protein
MKGLDWKSSLLAVGAGGILLLGLVWLYDQVLSDPADPLMPHAHLGLWFLLGGLVGLSTQSAERFTGAS